MAAVNKAPNQLFGHDIAGPKTAKPANPDPGTFYFDMDSNHWLVWSGTSWQNSGDYTGVNGGNPLTALVGGGQAGATPLLSTQNEFTTVTNDHDSCLLPPSVAGKWIVVINFGGHILDVYANASETINAIAALSPFSINASKVAIFFCPRVGFWYTVLTA
jgi:hypothetical protein